MSSLQQLNKQISLTTVVITLVLMAGLILPTNFSSLFIQNVNAGSGGQIYRSGKLLSRGIVRTEAGNPIWVEIDVDGTVVTDINEAIDEYKDAKAISVLSYLSIVNAFNNFKNEYKDGIAKGATVLTREEYIRKKFPDVEVPLLKATQDDANKTKTVAIKKYQLRDNTKSVLVRHENTVIDPNLLPTEGTQRGMILFEASINLQQSNIREGFDPNTKSLLISDKGMILKMSPYNIGYKTHFYKIDAAGDYTKELLGPVAGAHVDAASYSFNIPTVSSAKGEYSMPVSLCLVRLFPIPIYSTIGLKYIIRTLIPKPLNHLVFITLNLLQKMCISVQVMLYPVALV